MVDLLVAEASPAFVALALAFYSIALFGFVYIIGHSTISAPIRRLIAPEDDDPKTPMWAIRMWIIILVECPACAATWVGGGVGVLLAHVLDLTRLGMIVAVVSLATYSCSVGFMLGKKFDLIN